MHRRGLVQRGFDPLPFPTQIVGPLLGFLLSVEKSGADEGSNDARKVKDLVKAGADTNETDTFGRPALCYTAGPETTELLLEAGADPDVVANMASIKSYAANVVGSFYVTELVSTITRIKPLMYPRGFGGQDAVDLDTTAPKVADIVTAFNASLSAAYRRAIYSVSPLAEALASGKFRKAEKLLEMGASPVVELAGAPEVGNYDLTGFVAEGSEQYEALRERFGDAVWRGIAETLLWQTATSFTCPPALGSTLLQSNFVTTAARRHKQERLRSALLEKLLAAEADAGLSLGPAEPYDAIDASPGEQLQTQAMCTNAIQNRPRADAQALTADEEEIAMAAAIAHDEERLRERSLGKGKVGTGEDWGSYRTRTMSFKRHKENRVSEVFDSFDDIE